MSIVKMHRSPMTSVHFLCKEQDVEGKQKKTKKGVDKRGEICYIDQAVSSGRASETAR